MNIFETYLDKIIDLIKKANQDNLITLPENLSGINVDIPPSKFNCDMSTNVAMVLSKPNNKSPIEIAEIISNIIKQNEIGELINMQSYFGVNIVEKKNIFGFKRLKINKKNRLFDKKLGGGSILDLGCYPSSLSILIASLKSDEYKKEFFLTDIEKTIGPTDVDLEAFAKINFNNEFTSDIASSFKKNLGKSSIIIGSKGKIILPDSWHCETLNIIVNGNEYKINQKYKNIFSYQIENIGNSLLNNKIEPKYPAIKRYETEMNMYIFTKWLYENKK